MSTIHYELEHFYPKFDRQKFWDLFVDYEGWSKSKYLPGKITILKAGKGHPLGVGATRLVDTGLIKMKEDILGFRESEYFQYTAHDGSLPVDNFGGELFFEDFKDGLLIKYKGRFNSKYFGTGWLLRKLLSKGQKQAFKSLGKAYKEKYR